MLNMKSSLFVIIGCLFLLYSPHNFAKTHSLAGVTLSGNIAVSSTFQNNNPRNRTFTFHLPSEHPACNRPLLIVLHGDGGNGAGIMSYTGFNDIADADNFLVVYPDAMSVGGGIQWNKFADGTTGSGDNGNDANAPDDEKFMSDLIDYCYTNYGIDRSKVYVTGHSGGGFMAYFLTISNQTKNKIAAIAPVAASLWGNNSYLNTQFGISAFVPTAVFHVHATTDNVVPFPTLGSWTWPLSSFSSSTCTNSSYTTTAINAMVDKHTFCASGNQILLMSLKQAGLGHGWPTLANASFNASQEIWNFCKNFSKGTFVSACPCVSNLVVSSANFSNNTANQVVQAAQTIASISPPPIVITNSNSNNLSYQAGNSITLNAGFSVNAGATFKAQITGCLSNNFYVQGRFLKDPCGNTVTLKGINKMFVWTDQAGASFPEIAQTGANVVRIVWEVSEGGVATNDVVLDSLIARCMRRKMIPMVELHDATCNLSGLQALVNYWKRPAILAIINKYRHALLLNIGNEVGDYTTTHAQFQTAYTAAVQELRSAGIAVPLVIDAPNCGGSIDAILATATALQNADPLHNCLFSLHPYWPMNDDSNPNNGNSGYGTTGYITSKLEAAVAANIPLIVGELCNYGAWNNNENICTSSGQVNYQWIATEATRLGIGYLIWEWGPGNDGGGNSLCTIMNMTTNSTYATLTSWGLSIVNNPTYGIKTAQKTPYILAGFKNCQ